jgi:hypothetical protein
VDVVAGQLDASAQRGPRTLQSGEHVAAEGTSLRFAGGPASPTSLASPHSTAKAGQRRTEAFTAATRNPLFATYS